jgi:amidase
MVRDWKDLVAQKRADVAKALPSEWRLPSSILDTINASSDISVLDVPAQCGLMTQKELDITEKHDAVDLIAKMASKELSCFEVTTAFCKRAAIAQQVVRTA